MLTVRLERLALAPGERVLDLGCGEGRHVHAFHLAPGVQTVGLDADAPSLAKAAEGLEMLGPGDGRTLFIRGDAYRLPFDERAFDVVVCCEVLEHLPDVDAALEEIDRVLKPGGRLAVSVPRAWPERICWSLAPGPGGYADQPGGHVRIFEARALRRTIAGLGFAWRGGHHAHALHSPFWWLKTAFWARRDDHPFVCAYHRFLVWDLMRRPRITRALERLLDPLMGKSVVLYFDKPAEAGAA
ncbi:MAG TPA: methyltransferase domain-containing protein [Caulobacteraceae bacterium]|jgi:SAM-dependent methyltransferase|nr:methyltransferase domain-containing protein [Caulobacteraceae bacterium]